MSAALFFFDLETSGLDPKRHAIIQAAWRIERLCPDWQVFADRCMDVKLTVGDIDLKALEINHFTLKRIADGVEPARFLHLLKDDLMTAGFAERVVPCGHCVNFDLDFLSVLCDRMHDNLFMYISRSAMLDTCALARWLTHAGKLKVPDHKLDTICKHLDIPLKPHDAGEDVLAVREVYHKFKALL